MWAERFYVDNAGFQRKRENETRELAMEAELISW